MSPSQSEDADPQRDLGAVSQGEAWEAAYWIPPSQSHKLADGWRAAPTGTHEWVGSEDTGRPCTPEPSLVPKSQPSN